jgi:hypothetical protein
MSVITCKYSSHGEGYSRYVNDQGSINKSDAAFNPLTGQLDPVPFFAMYIAFQKWWSPTMRSNFNYGYVSVENKVSNIVPSAYQSTDQFTANYIWSPIARIDLGAELLIGSRTNENGEKVRQYRCRFPLNELPKPRRWTL